jgi:hypothetical protein
MHFILTAGKDAEFIVARNIVSYTSDVPEWIIEEASCAPID